MAFLLIIVFSFGFIVITTVIEVSTLGNRVEDNVVASGWSGFSKIDLDKLAQRNNINDKENRNVFLKKTEAINIVKEFIRDNLSLDNSLYPTEQSYIADKTRPIKIEEVDIFNPDDLNRTCSRGVTFNRTTIHIVVKIPVKLKFIGFQYLEKHVDVDTKTMFKN